MSAKTCLYIAAITLALLVLAIGGWLSKSLPILQPRQHHGDTP